MQAPTSGSIILAAIMLKLGTFGFIRYSFGLLAPICSELGPIVCVLALASIIFSSVSSITEVDAKKLIAQTSIAHMNLCVLGLFSFDIMGYSGCIYMLVGHAITATALFYLVGVAYDRFHTRDINAIGGLASTMPLYSVFMFFFTMANAGFP